MGGKVVAHCLSAASTKRNVVLAGAALISVTFNSEYVLAIRLEPLRLLVQRGDGLRGEVPKDPDVAPLSYPIGI